MFNTFTNGGKSNAAEPIITEFKKIFENTTNSSTKK